LVAEERLAWLPSPRSVSEEPKPERFCYQFDAD
jgi:hypothetical protein